MFIVGIFDVYHCSVKNRRPRRRPISPSSWMCIVTTGSMHHRQHPSPHLANYTVQVPETTGVATLLSPTSFQCVLCMPICFRWITKIDSVEDKIEVDPVELVRVWVWVAEGGGTAQCKYDGNASWEKKKSKNPLLASHALDSRSQIWNGIFILYIYIFATSI